MNERAVMSGLTPFTLYSGNHNVGNRLLELDILAMCKEMGLAMVPWNIFGEGKYLGK